MHPDLLPPELTTDDWGFPRDSICISINGIDTYYDRRIEVVEKGQTVATADEFNAEFAKLEQHAADLEAKLAAAHDALGKAPGPPELARLKALEAKLATLVAE